MNYKQNIIDHLSSILEQVISSEGSLNVNQEYIFTNDRLVLDTTVIVGKPLSGVDNRQVNMLRELIGILTEETTEIVKLRYDIDHYHFGTTTTSIAYFKKPPVVKKLTLKEVYATLYNEYFSLHHKGYEDTIVSDTRKSNLYAIQNTHEAWRRQYEK